MSRRVTVGSVVSVWALMFECANQATPRGTLVGWNHEDAAAALDYDPAEVAAIYDAMQGKTLDGNRLTAWEKRQPQREREDTTAAERKRAQRARERAAGNEGHDASHQVTPRGEERREEKKPLSVGKGEDGDSRGDTPEPPSTRSPDEAGAKQEPTIAGQVARALIAAGVTHVNPSHATLLRLIGEGVTEREFADAAVEAKAKGKGTLAYVCAVVEGRRRDAATAAGLPALAGAAASTNAAKRVGATEEFLAQQREHRARVDAQRQNRARAGPPADPPSDSATHTGTTT